MFRDEYLETLPQKELRSFQLEKLNRTLETANKSPYYKKLFRQCGLKPHADNLHEIRKFPFTTKDDLRKSYPAGMVTTPFADIVRMHASSGTTGKSTLVFHTMQDIENWANLVARGLYAAGVRKTDIFQNMMSYGLFTGGLGLHYGAEKIGALVLPVGSGNTHKQIELLIDLKATVLHITPSYLLYLGHVIEEAKIPLSSFSFKIAILGAEPHSEATRRKLEKMFHIKAFNCYGLSEMNGPGVAFECIYRKGLHLWEDSYYGEIINPGTGEVLPEGEEGELVLTTLQREGMPVIRYRTKDITRFIKEKCGCGRTHRRIVRIKGRTDDMFVIKGVNVFPSQIEAVLMETPEVDKNYRIILDRKEGLDVLTVEIEIKREYFRGDINQLRALQGRMTSMLKDAILVTPVVELVEPGTLPPSTGKAQRVLDKRRV
ncbi:MAG: phenylacetate--CoA ligase [Candidatus Omnitrophica bacterium]|nr:phenylacetate--CoA ligase [Candidatus Omnitrophota bacterium]